MKVTETLSSAMTEALALLPSRNDSSPRTSPARDGQSRSPDPDARVRRARIPPHQQDGPAARTLLNDDVATNELRVVYAGRRDAEPNDSVASYCANPV